MAKAWRALTEAFLANPVTATLAALLALLPLIKAGIDLFTGSLDEANKKLYGAGTAASALERNLKATEAAAKKAGEALKLAASDSATDFDRLNTSIDAAAKRLDQLAAAEKDRALAQIDLEEAQQLADAKNDEERKAIKGAADNRRGAINQVADVDSRSRDEAAAIAKRDAADQAIGAARGQIGGAQAGVDQLSRQLSLLFERGKEWSSLPESTTAQQILADTQKARVDLAAASKNLADVTKQLAPLIQNATRQREDANATLDAADKRRQAQETRIVAGGINQASDAEQQKKALRDAINQEEAKSYLGRVRNPVDLNADQESAVMKRAGEINAAALSQEGRQAGETMGEAVALAMKEMFPQLTAAYLRAMRAQINDAIKAEVDRIDAQIKGLRTR
jgi:hypothetical protein